MKFKKIFRDFGVLVAFCGAFYLLVTFVNRLDGGNQNSDSDFSPTRKQADRYFYRESDFTSAAEQYEKLTQVDPHNGLAWSMLASSRYEERTAAKRQLDQVDTSDESRADEYQRLEAEVERLSLLAYEAYTQLNRFARYRRDSNFWLAVLDAGLGSIEFGRGNREAAQERYERSLDLLGKFISQGGRTRGGLANFAELGSGGPSMSGAGVTPTADTRLHFEPRFWEIVAREQRSRGR